jgi:hypothetical protein
MYIYCLQQVRERGLELGDTLFQLSNAVCHASGDRCRKHGCHARNRFDFVGYELLPTLFLLARLTLEQSDQAVVDKVVQAALDIVHRVEWLEALGSCPQLGRCLRAANKEHGHHGRGFVVETELLVGDLAISGNAATVRRVDDAHQTLRLHRRDRRLDFMFVERHDRVTRRRLVACQHQSVHRQRVLIGHGAFFLHQAAEHPAFDHGEHEVELTAANAVTHTMNGVLRLRQVVIAARDLDDTVQHLCQGLGLSVCFNDPSVAEFGLQNALLTVGDQFIEVVSPISEGTAAGRLLDRRQAAITAYMVMFEVDDLDARMATLADRGVRTVWSGDFDMIRGRHLHPADIGGAIVSLDETHPPGSWLWAGPSWTAHADNTVVTAIAGYTIAVDDPDAVTARWSQLGLSHAVRFVGGQESQIELTATDRNATGQTLTLDQLTLRRV